MKTNQKELIRLLKLDRTYYRDILKDALDNKKLAERYLKKIDKKISLARKGKKVSYITN